MKDPQNSLSDQESDPTGSPPTGEPAFLAVGVVNRAHGIKGNLVMNVLTDFPERLRPGRTLYIGEEHQAFQIVTARPHGKTMMIKLKGIDDRETAATFNGQVVYVPTKNIPKLPPGEYYFHQLLGLTVIDEQGQVLGTLESILETRANDVYLIKTPDGSEMLLPAVEEEVVLGVDLERREMRVRPPQWD
jgi:16S rRNA processing protein RimM